MLPSSAQQFGHRSPSPPAMDSIDSEMAASRKNPFDSTIADGPAGSTGGGAGAQPDSVVTAAAAAILVNAPALTPAGAAGSHRGRGPVRCLGGSPDRRPMASSDAERW